MKRPFFWMNAALVAILNVPLIAAGNTIAEWKLDARENNSVAEVTGKFPGQIRGNIDALRIENGFSGKAFFFDAGKFYIEIPSSEGLSLKNNFTIEAVIKPDDVAGYHTILWKGKRSVKPESVGYYLNLRDGKLDFKGKKEDGSWFGWLTTEAAIEKGKWVHVAVTFKDGNAELFVNGEKKSTSGGGSGTPNELIPNDYPLIIGCGEGSGGAPDYHFSGLIEWIRFARGADFDRSPSRFSLFALTLIESRLAEATAGLAEKLERTALLKAALQKHKAELKGRQADEITSDLREIESSFRDLEKGTSELRASLNKNLSQLAGPGFSGLGKSGNSMELLEKLHAFAENLCVNKASSPNAGEGIPPALFSLDADFSALATKQLGLAESLLRKSESRYLEALAFGSGASFLAFAVPVSAALVKKTGVLRELGVLTNGAKLRLARGESESLLAVLVASPDKEGVEKITVKTPGWSGPELEWAPVKTVDSSKSIVPLDEKGPVYDIIMDGEKKISIPKGMFVPVHLRVSAARNQIPGKFKNSISFLNGNETRTIDLEIEVMDFELPLASSLKVAFTFREGDYQTWYGKNALSDEDKLSIYSFLLRYRISPNNIYSKEVYPPISLMPKLLERGANLVTLGYIASKKAFSSSELDSLVRETGDKLDALKKMGFPEDNIYLYSYDELAVQSYDRNSARDFTARLQKEFPKLKLMQTSVPAPPFDGWFNVWVPPIESFMTVKPEYRNRPGTELWWYWVSVTHPFPNFFLGYPAYDGRIAMVLGKKYGLSGCLYWALNREWTANVDNKSEWPESEWKPKYMNSINGAENSQAGQGNLIYPGPDGRLWPSLRLEAIRDGVEDFDAITLLESKLASRPELKAEIQALLEMPKEVAVSVNAYSADPKALWAWRDKIYTFLDAASKSK